MKNIKYPDDYQQNRSARVSDRRHRLAELTPDGVTLSLRRPLPSGGVRVHILALGDVGASLLLGLKVLGGGTIGTIGIFDVDEKVCRRYEMEMNQIGWAFEEQEENPLPSVEIVTEENLFDCDLFLFCASKAVPAVGASAGAGDVRMVQFDANRKIVEHYARMAGERGYEGIFAVVSDPVDPLCKAALLASGLLPGQIRGYGLGVMNRRAVYYARRDERFSAYLTEGRAFGPHGADLVVANSIENYDDALSRQLTTLTVEANLRVRDLGFKPYLAPALSSGAMSVIRTLQGKWHYSSIYLGSGPAGQQPCEKSAEQRPGGSSPAWQQPGGGPAAKGAFLGVKNRITGTGLVYEDLELPEALYERIRTAYENLCRIL